MLNSNQPVIKNEDQNQDKRVKVYVRINHTKKGNDFICQSKISESQLVDLVEQVIRQSKLVNDETPLQHGKLQYVIQGHKIGKNSSHNVHLRQGNIIHVLNPTDSKRNKITLNLRYKNLQTSQNVSHSLQVSTSQRIEESLQKALEVNFNKFLCEVSLVYLGTELSSELTFSEASIQNQSEIIVIDKLNSGNDENQSFQNAEEITSQFFGMNFNNVKTVKPRQQIPLIGGLNMPFNPRLLPQKVKKMLEQNLIANQEEIQRSRSLSPQGFSNVPILLPFSHHQMPFLNSSQNNQEQKMDEQKDIPTKQQIQEEQDPQQIQIQK